MSEDDRTHQKQIVQGMLDNILAESGMQMQLDAAHAKLMNEGGLLRTYFNENGKVKIEHIPDSEFYAPFDEVGK